MYWPFYFKFVPIHATKTYRGSGGTPSFIFNLGIRWRWKVNFTSQLHIAKDTGWAPEPTWKIFEKIKPLIPEGIFFCLYSLVFYASSILLCLHCPPFCLFVFTTHNTNIQAAGGIRTRNLSKRSAADPRLRPFSNWNSNPAPSSS